MRTQPTGSALHVDDQLTILTVFLNNPWKPKVERESIVIQYDQNDF